MTDTPLTRRDALGALGAVGLGALLSACADADEPSVSGRLPPGERPPAPAVPEGEVLDELFEGARTCTLTREQIEGPYSFDLDAVRSDLREDRAGVLLRLALQVQDAACRPVPGAAVELWQCDAVGLYSGFEDASTGRAAGRGRTDDQTYLRGTQVTGADGVVQFTTVYPGWYRGRATHVHLKVHLDRETLLTTQLYFDEAVTAAVYEQQPYHTRGPADTSNGRDAFFEPDALLDLRPHGEGWLGVLVLGVRA